MILTTSSANSNAAVIANEIAAVGSTVVAPVIATTHNANSNAAVIAKDIAAVGSTVIAPVIAPTNNANSNASVIAKVSRTVVAPVVARTSSVNSNASVIENEIAAVGSTVAAPVVARTNNANSNAAVIARDTAAVGRTVVAPAIAPTSTANSNAAVIAKDIAKVGSTAGVGVQRKRTPAKTFDEQFDLLKEFKEQHGHCKPGKTDVSLNNWCSNVKYAYRSFQRGDNKGIKINEERIRRLEEIGFPFSAIHEDAVKASIIAAEDVNSNVSDVQNGTEKDDTAKADSSGADENPVQLDQRIEALKIFKEQHGHCNATGGLGTWCRAVRNAHNSLQRAGIRMEEDLLRRLEEIGFDFNPEQKSQGGQPKRKTSKAFDVHFEALKEFKKQHGHCKPGKTDIALNAWCSNVRYAYRSLQRGESKGIKLDEEHIRRLEQIGFQFDLVNSTIPFSGNTSPKLDSAADGVMASKQVAFPKPVWTTIEKDTAKADVTGAETALKYDANINMPTIEHGTTGDGSAVDVVMTSTDKANSNISAIHEDAVKASITAAEDVNSNVSDVQNGTEKDDTAKADSSGADENPVQLDQRIEALKIFKEQHGHCNATGGLGTWCRAVRNAHNSLQRAGIRMEEDLLRRLEEIGFDFNPEQKSQRGQHKRKAFDEQFDLLKEFKKQHGHCKPGKTDVSLNNWCSNVKYAHRSLQRGESKGIKLDEERIRRLEQIGFHFDSIKIPNPGSPGVEKIRSSRGSFDKNLEDLRKFKEIHGHCNPSKQDDGSLGQWCANIRAAYGYKQRGESKKGMKLDDDRIRRLEEMGFLMLPTNCRRRSTSPHITHDVDHGFDLRLQELRAYKKENGHCNPRICGRNLNYASLTNWCCNLRSAYKCMQSGQPSKGLRLTNYRIRCLDDMGFQWTIRGAKGSSPVETMDNNLQTPDTQLQQVSISVSIIPEQKLGVSMMKNVETSGYEVMALSKESPLVGALNVGDIITHLNDQRLCVLDDEQVQEMMQRNSERGGEIRVLFSRKNLWKELLLDRSSRSIECPSSFTTLGLVLRYSQACKGLVVFHVSDSSPFQGKMKEGDAITHLNSTSLAQCLPPEFVAKIRSSTEKESILSVSRVKDFENVKEFCARQKKKKIPVFKDSENIYRGAGNIAFTGRMTVEGLIVTKIDSSSMESEPFRVGDLILKIDGNTASNSFVNFSDNQVHEIVFRSLDTNPMPLSQSSREGGGDGTLESEPLSQSSKEGGGDGNLEVELVIAPKSIESVFLPSEMPNIKIASLPVCHAFIVNDTESEAKADEKNKNLQETARRKNLRKRKIRTAGKTAKRRKAPVYSGISVDFGGGWTEEVYKKDSDGSKYKYWFSPVKKYRFRTKKSVRLFEDALTRCNNEDEAFEMIKKSLR